MTSVKRPTAAQPPRERRPREESNLRTQLRRLPLYPLSYGAHAQYAARPRASFSAGGRFTRPQAPLGRGHPGETGRSAHGSGGARDCPAAARS